MCKYFGEVLQHTTMSTTNITRPITLNTPTERPSGYIGVTINLVPISIITGTRQKRGTK